ncbi:cytochrome c biogenesis protein CcdA [Thermosipho ferrireducens]|uniref:Cytochrome c biogenesis protein CcdA n=1 Tax=Thermosipho ferrireducens TaxID=2571116 RepID=A0ABX7S811_9BACT|nr:cytochrome c biogenesis CcdA family protein [Thermosipho ferrireducens]QTA38728.1 cytochrome c biogenesis protein CcdA [Thermosipho ferrireducens]
MIQLYKDVSFWTALVHGFIAFFSPCIIPLIPAFLGILFTAERKILKIFGFFIGFSLLFAIIGIFSGQLGFILGSYSNIINYVLGGLIILMGILYLLKLQLIRQVQIDIWKFKGGGFITGIIFGGSIAIIWIPCSSPVLGSILSIAASGNAIKGGFLLFVYSIGISIPFLTIGTSISKILTYKFGKPIWENLLRILGAFFIIFSGILIFFGKIGV